MIRRSTEEGFAMAALIFFLTAISILIAVAVPDYLMEAQRQQEQELIFRGQEYTRAILKFQRKYKVYPPSIDALLSTNNIRFLRQAYKDPITGKPMRLITLNADGSVSGSVLYSTGASIANAGAVGGSLGSTSIGTSSLNSSGLSGASGTSGTSGTSGSVSSAEFHWLERRLANSWHDDGNRGHSWKREYTWKWEHARKRVHRLFDGNISRRWSKLGLY